MRDLMINTVSPDENSYEDNIDMGGGEDGLLIFDGETAGDGLVGEFSEDLIIVDEAIAQDLEGDLGDNVEGIEGAGDIEGLEGIEGLEDFESLEGMEETEDFENLEGMEGLEDDFYIEPDFVDDGMYMDIGMETMYPDMGMETEEVKDPLLSSWWFIIVITVAVLLAGAGVGTLLAKLRIKKGIELYED